MSTSSSASNDLLQSLRNQQPMTTATQTVPLQLKSISTQYPIGTTTIEIQTESSTTPSSSDSSLLLNIRTEEELNLLQLNDIQKTKPIIRELGIRMLNELNMDTYKNQLSTHITGTNISSSNLALYLLQRSLEELNNDNDNNNEPVLLRTFTHPFLQPDEYTDNTNKPNTTTLSTDMSLSGSTFTTSRNSIPYRYLPCTNIAWNIAGSLLAGSFGHREHNGWCHHRAGVIIWNAFRSSSSTPLSSTSDTKTDTNTWKPEYILDTDSCITSVVFHPEEAGIIAGGTVNGDIYVWNIYSNATTTTISNSGAVNDPLVCRSRMNDYIHREPIMNLSWTYDNLSRTYTLLSLSREGKLSIWSLHNQLLHPLSTAQLALSSQKLRQHQQRLKPTNEDSKRRYDDSEDDSDHDMEEKKYNTTKKGVYNKNNDNNTSISGTCCSFPLQGKQGIQSGFFIGGGGGGIYTCTIPISAAAIATSNQKEGSQWRPVHRPGAINKTENTLPWEQAAVEILLRAPEIERARICRMVERYAREVNATIVTLGLLYACRIDELQMNVNAGMSSSNTSTTISNNNNSKGILFPNPIRFSLLPHTGTVLSIAASYYHRNLFISSGMDGKIHVYSALLMNPLLIFEPNTTSSNTGIGTIKSATSSTSTNNDTNISLRNTITPVYSLAWSPIRPLVFAGGCGNGTVVIYDLYHQTTNTPVLILPYQDIMNQNTSSLSSNNNMDNKLISSLPYTSLLLLDPSVSDGAILGISFNQQQRRIVATCDSYGRIMVWKLPWNYGRSENHEELALNRFMSYALAEQQGQTNDEGGNRIDQEENNKKDNTTKLKNNDGTELPRNSTSNSKHPNAWKDLELQAEHSNSLGNLWKKLNIE